LGSIRPISWPALSPATSEVLDRSHGRSAAHRRARGQVIDPERA